MIIKPPQREIRELRPQAGPQDAFLRSRADIAIYGGAAGGGKSYGLLLEPLRHISNPRFGGMIFRREAVQIRKTGGLWDESVAMYSGMGVRHRETMLEHIFPSRAKVQFSHLETDATVYSYQGSQIPFIGYDELTHFSKKQFIYMLSRNRSTCGVKPYIRATTNPDADSWVAEFIAWWIDQETGYPIPERSAVVRYFIRRDEDVHWADSPQELVDKYAGCDLKDVKSATFISAKLSDNKILMESDPGYMANLKALSQVERERLLNGNWKIRPSAGLYFQRRYFEIVDVAPANARRVRHWDLAGTAGDGDWTAGLRLSIDENKQLYIEHIERLQGSPAQVRTSIRNIAESDGRGCRISLPQDPGQAGKAQADEMVKMLAGYSVTVRRETGDKVTRANPASAQAERGNIKLVRGAWNEAFLNEVENFPDAKHDDQVDALSGAYETLVSAPQFFLG